MPSARRFPTIDEHNDTCFIRDHSGQALANVYFEEEPGRLASNLLTRDEARRIAANVAKLPGLIGRWMNGECSAFPTHGRRAMIGS